MKHLYFILIAIFLHVGVAQADPGFDQWLKGLKREARGRGIATSLIDQAFRGVKPLPRVLELDRNQPESTMSFAQYKQHIVSPMRIERGRQMMAQYGDLLQEVGQHYGVQPRFIVALWGIETDYGSNTGNFNIIEALMTLAYDGRRSQYFRRELLNSLQILQEGHSSLVNMKGSWAGAMGQSQFMPSSFRQYAIDHNGDGRRDIWTSHGDIFASIANYLARAGWRGDRTWGRRVTIPADFDPALAGLKVRKPLPTWQQLGLRRADGRDLPRQPLQASLLLPEGPKGTAYLVYHNFRTLLKWNRSNYFALAVGQLTDALRAE